MLHREEERGCSLGSIESVAKELRRPVQAPWRKLLKEAVRDPAELLRMLDLPAELGPAARRAAEQFPLRVPRGFVARMRKGDLADPLLRQVLPLDAELTETPGFLQDPVGDLDSVHTPGLLHKYQGRALLVLTGACAVHCRYCFRRHFPYDESPRGLEQWGEALAAIAADSSIEEVLLSGGDPLSLVDETLRALWERLSAIPHVRRIRIHSRWPVVLPERTTDELVELLAESRPTPIVVIHANHAAELDDTVAAALHKLRKAGTLLFNQAVLLRGVNDSVEALQGLSLRLVDLRTTPYYLHQLDRVQGGAHFEVPLETGLALMDSLRRRLPGYAVPKYVRETAGAPFKVPLDFASATADAPPPDFA